jgi:hypothetical protein
MVRRYTLSKNDRRSPSGTYLSLITLTSFILLGCILLISPSYDPCAPRPKVSSLTTRISHDTSQDTSGTLNILTGGGHSGSKVFFQAHSPSISRQGRSYSGLHYAQLVTHAWCRSSIRRSPRVQRLRYASLKYLRMTQTKVHNLKDTGAMVLFFDQHK